MIELPRRSRPDIHADINIVPYIDVMLVLLVIFMMTTPIIEQGMEVKLPEGPANVLDYSDGPQPTVITIDSKNRYFINSLVEINNENTDDIEPVSLTIIVNQVVARMNVYPDMAVVLRGDKSADYGILYSLMLQLKANGVDKVSFSSENPN
jgi:biopolymer transport protein TolR|tara:strand:- start:552 stop:1004 length:453 start_codon:yes stop_codon:yes gene_type:complete